MGLGSSFLGAGFSAYTTDKRQIQDIGNLELEAEIMSHQWERSASVHMLHRERAIATSFGFFPLFFCFIISSFWNCNVLMSVSKFSSA